ncbi:phage holin family protein [Amedibacillus sp. YH-ame6]
MDFSQLTQYFVFVVLIACLIVGYILKTSFDSVPNKYIPTILACIGTLLNVFVSGISVESIVYGALTGLASTGMHQAFTRFIEGKKEDTALPK